MNKKIVRLTESDLHKIVRESTHKMLNEIGDSSDGQYILGRTAERASQRADRTYGVDRRRYDKTFKDAYSTAAKASKKHLGRPFGGTNDAFEKGRDDESDKWEETLTIESTNMNKKTIRLTESDLHRIIKESVNRVLKEEVGKKDVFTVSAFDIESEEDVSDMKVCGQIYYDIDDAIAAATELAQSFVNYGSVVMVTVFAGEYEKDNGDIFGEPEAIYAISNSDKRTTAIARKRCGYVRSDVDAYAV